jgi:predicted ATP-binding protein involved in virulence
MPVKGVPSSRFYIFFDFFKHPCLISNKKHYLCAHKKVDFQGAFDWLYRYDQNLKKGIEFEGTREAFIQALTEAIPAMSDVHIDTKNNELSALLTVTGQTPSYQVFEHMSDGFKSVICIVAEIAHRCIELNGFLGDKAVRMTPGIVMIDELDLYLHPRWQRHILEDLQRAFPLIQFIVSSHSPFIIQSVRSRNLITLDGVNDVTDPVCRSIEEIVLKEMNMDTPRSTRYNQMVEKAELYYQLVAHGEGDDERAQQIKQELDHIELEFSDDPAYVALLKAERNSR